MKKRYVISPIVIFSLAQLSWFALLGLWIYWYQANYIIFAEVGLKIFPQLVFNTRNIVALVGGLVLLVAIAVGMSLNFGKLNEQLKVTRMYDNFIANVSHELKSPLASIQLYLETLKDRDVPRRKQIEFLHLMLKDTDRLNNLIKTILEISGLEEKRTIFQYSIHKAGQLVRTLVEEAVEQFNLPEGSVTIIGEAPCECRVDQRALRIVFNNLIDNAIKYSLKQVHITITLKCQGKRVIIDVTDRGIGISLVDQKKVFKKFHRIYNPESPNVKGTGLGLYWVKEIIKQHRGKIEVASPGINKGATFRIELPAYFPKKPYFMIS